MSEITVVGILFSVYYLFSQTLTFPYGLLFLLYGTHFHTPVHDKRKPKRKKSPRFRPPKVGRASLRNGARPWPSNLFASLVISLLSAFLAMLGKQWLNRYASAEMRGSAVPTTETRYWSRCH